ncbi:MAG: sulfotransferase domain-containing protein [Deltaproteobacteria bacterium]|nr:sulfotransferase domain-containing protein [Deltaproteobacteria bacterium]
MLNNNLMPRKTIDLQNHTIDSAIVPRKTHEFQNHTLDSTIWNDFEYRDNDIVIASWARSGTTWVQQIVKQLIFGGNPDLDTSALSFFLELLMLPKEEKIAIVNNQFHRRFFKTHLAVNNLVFSPKAKYIYVGRNAPDIVWSLYNWLKKFRKGSFAIKATVKERVGPPLERPTVDFYEFWKRWLYEDGYPMWPFWNNVRSWWNIRNLPYVKLIHFNSLKENLEREISGIEYFLDIQVTSEQMERIMEYCSYDWMKKNPLKTTPEGSDSLVGGAEAFYLNGNNAQWKNYLSTQDITEYKEYAIDKLGNECANWLFSGQAI